MSDHLRANRPVVVQGEMTHWPLFTRPVLKFLVEYFGDERVQVYDSLFNLTDVVSLRSYIHAHFSRQDGAVAAYIRWYTKFRDVDFAWSDHVFKQIAADWKQPRFLPRSGYVLPYCAPSVERDVTIDAFPYKGIFISGRGARTRLHRDPLGSDAIICQLRGRKSVRFYPPSVEQLLERSGEFYDPDAPDHTQFPEAQYVLPSYECEIGAGDVLFVPNGWFHDARTLTDSISLTWNFVHHACADRFVRALHGLLDRSEMDTLRYFFSNCDTVAICNADKSLHRSLVRAGVIRN